MCMKRLTLLLLVCFSVKIMPAQQKIILEELRFGSAGKATMLYWKNEEVRKIFASQLNTLLLKYHQLPLADTTLLPLHDLNEEKAGLAVSPPRYTDTSDLHLFLDVLESTPLGLADLVNLPLTPQDSAMMAGATSIFRLRASLEKARRVVSAGTLDIIISRGVNGGMGIESPIVAMMPKTFTEVLKNGFDVLLNPENDIAELAMKVPPAYAADNFILRKTMKQPRIYVTQQKDISVFLYNNQRQMLRNGIALYEEARVKGKKADPLPANLLAAIRATPHFSYSDYVFLRQDWRDVIGNKDYLLKMIVQMDPDHPPLSVQYAFTNFIPGNFHYLLQDTDTVAAFSIEQAQMGGREKKVFGNVVSNGVDTASLYEIGKPVDLPVIYAYSVKGELQGRSFAITCSGNRNVLKEIFLEDKLVCIAQGKFSPEKFVVFDASLSPETLKQLFMIGFNRFFE
ncbi:MAG: hypothetical protein JWQ78_1069 [Sediminibacterium sp.]|nr:hypothetical protein [Sediminibacterium sp.]